MVKYICLLLCFTLMLGIPLTYSDTMYGISDLTNSISDSFESIKGIVGLDKFNTSNDSISLMNRKLNSTTNKTVRDLLEYHFDFVKVEILKQNLEFVYGQSDMFRSINENVYKVVYDDGTFDYALKVTISGESLPLGSDEGRKKSVSLLWINPTYPASASTVDDRQNYYHWKYTITGDLMHDDIYTNFYAFTGDYLHPIFNFYNIDWYNYHLTTFWTRIKVNSVLVTDEVDVEYMLNQMLLVNKMPFDNESEV